jgi:hypothetical protein
VRRRLNLYTYLNAELAFVYNGETVGFGERPAGPDRGGDGRGGHLSALPLPQQDAGDRLHPQQPVQRDPLFLRQRAVHQRRRHPPERVPGGHPQGGQRLHQEDVRGRRRARGHDRRGGHPAEGPGVRVADQEQAGQHRDPHRPGEGGSTRGGGPAPPRPQAGRAPGGQGGGHGEAAQGVAAVKKMARERARAISIRIPQLKDCKHHLDRKRGQGRGLHGLSSPRASPPPAPS